MTFIDEGVLQSIPCREQMQHSNSHFRNQPLGKKYMTEGGNQWGEREKKRERGRENERRENIQDSYLGV